MVTPGSGVVLPNGELMETAFPALAEEGELLLPRNFFSLLGLRSSYCFPETGPEREPDGRLVTP